MSYSLDIIIVNWNTGTLLRDCLRTIAGSDRVGFFLNRVVVVDNASDDGSADDLPILDLPLAVIRNSRNSGFAAACNMGARDSMANFLLFLNPDTGLTANSLSSPVSVMLQPQHWKTGILGIQLHDSQGRISRSCNRFPTFFHFLCKMTGLDRIFQHHFLSSAMTDWDHCGSQPVDQVIGAFFMVRRRIFEELGGFDERFFVYYEELDFCLRALQKGWKTFYLSEANAFHKGGGASEAIKDIRLFYALRSQILYGFKHFRKRVAFFLLLAILMIEPVTRLANSAIKRSPEDIRNTLKAYKMLLNDFPNWFRLCCEMANTPSSSERRQDSGIS